MNVYQDALIPRDLPYPKRFLVTHLKCNNDLNQSGKVLLNVSLVLIIQIDRVNQNSSLVNNTELDFPLTPDLSSFIACDLKGDGISPLYRLTSCITYQGAFVKTGHYVCYIIHENGVTKFNDARIEYFSSLMVKRCKWLR